MVTKALYEYVLYLKLRGIAAHIVIEKLTAVGWQQEDIKQTYYLVGSNASQQKEKRQIPHKPIVFSFLLLLVLLIHMVTFISTSKDEKKNAGVLSEATKQITRSGAAEPAVLFSLPTVPPPNTELPASVSAKVASTASQLAKKINKKSYSIAVYGDSMVDTMGEHLEYLEQSLQEKYPSIGFTLYNYGIGSQNVEQGLARWQSAFSYQDRQYASLTTIRPDILILGTFAYNPFFPYDRDKHLLLFEKLILQAKEVTPHVYVLAEIAPLKNDFGKGLHGVNQDPTTAYINAVHITEQLQNAISLANKHGIPLINAYAASQIDGQFGKRSFVNGDDGIHPSVAGHIFTANKITATLALP